MHFSFWHDISDDNDNDRVCMKPRTKWRKKKKVKSYIDPKQAKWTQRQKIDRMKERNRALTQEYKYQGEAPKINEKEPRQQ